MAGDAEQVSAQLQATMEQHAEKVEHASLDAANFPRDGKMRKLLSGQGQGTGLAAQAGCPQGSFLGV